MLIPKIMAMNQVRSVDSAQSSVWIDRLLDHLADRSKPLPDHTGSRLGQLALGCCCLNQDSSLEYLVEVIQVLGKSGPVNERACLALVAICAIVDERGPWGHFFHTVDKRYSRARNWGNLVEWLSRYLLGSHLQRSIDDRLRHAINYHVADIRKLGGLSMVSQTEYWLREIAQHPEDEKTWQHLLSYAARVGQLAEYQILLPAEVQEASRQWPEMQWLLFLDGMERGELGQLEGLGELVAHPCKDALSNEGIYYACLGTMWQQILNDEPPDLEAALKTICQRFDCTRDQVAGWCTLSLRDFQAFVTGGDPCFPTTSRYTRLLTLSSFESSAPIRWALRSGDVVLARQMLTFAKWMGRERWLDQLYWGMVLLAEGSFNDATVAFDEVALRANRQGFQGRMQLELKLLPSLDPSIAFRMGPQCSAPRADTSSRAPSNDARAIDFGLVGVSEPLIAACGLVRQWADSSYPVLITGPTGVGKELLAQALHLRSCRHQQEMVTVHCGGLSESLLEAEIFGHEKGAFTGAQRARIGLVEQAGEGTLFFDEIGDASPSLQVLLLRLIENGEYRRIGSNHTALSRARIVAATNVDLLEACHNGKFRQDLLARLSMLEIHMPGLEFRSGDIAPILEHFLRTIDPPLSRVELDDELLAQICDRPLPGNARDLRSIALRMRLRFPGVTRFNSNHLSTVDREHARSSSSSSSGFFLAQQPQSGGGAIERRLEKVRELFRRHRVLSRRDLIEHLGIAPSTATSYLKTLIEKGEVERQCRNRSPNGQSFVWQGK